MFVHPRELHLKAFPIGYNMTILCVFVWGIVHPLSEFCIQS